MRAPCEVEIRVPWEPRERIRTRAIDRSALNTATRDGGRREGCRFPSTVVGSCVPPPSACDLLITCADLGRGLSALLAGDVGAVSARTLGERLVLRMADVAMPLGR